ncbi:hypothetical protein HN011_008431 [Eciton burchellii]|nr:hypothetical protein HN011_008431 [Eciton burchellii]
MKKIICKIITRTSCSVKQRRHGFVIFVSKNTRLLLHAASNRDVELNTDKTSPIDPAEDPDLVSKERNTARPTARLWQNGAWKERKDKYSLTSSSRLL